LVGVDVNKLVFTNIYRGFVDRNFDFDVEFFEPNLKRVQIVEHHSALNRGRVFHYLYGLSSGQFKTFLVRDESPKIIC
jgi:hypothetical protein